MSSGAKIQLYYAPEVTTGVLPTTGWKKVRRIKDGLTENVTSSKSESVVDSRFRQGSTADESEITGALEVELSINTFDDFFSAVAMNDWVEDSLDDKKATLRFGGDTTKTFTFVKVYSDTNQIHVYRGVRIGGLKLNLGVRSKIKATFDLLGTDFEVVTVNPVSNAADVDDNTLLSALNVIEMTVNDQNTVGTACVQSVELTVTNNLSRYDCLGNAKISAQGYNEKMIDILLNAQFMFSSQSATYIPYVKSKATMPLKFGIKDKDNNMYEFDFTKLEVKNAPNPDGGGEDDIFLDVEFEHIKETPVITRTLAA